MPTQPTPQNDNSTPVHFTASDNALSPVRCRCCGSTNLAFISDQHKCLSARFIALITIIVAVVLFIFDLSALFSNNEMNDSSYAIYIICAVVFLICQIIITIVESKTHIRVVCRDCGRTWLHESK